jgi:hypothetical protein
MTTDTIAVPRMASRRRRDWFRIIRDLMKAGISMGDIGRKCARDKATVKSWSDGCDPKESDARVVLALYAKHCPVAYVEHQKLYEVHIEIEYLTGEGETLGLPFVKGL